MLWDLHEIMNFFSEFLRTGKFYKDDSSYKFLCDYHDMPHILYPKIFSSAPKTNTV